MREFKTLEDFQQVAKPNDLIILGGRGIVNGIGNNSKHDTMKVCRVKEDGTIQLKKFRGRKTYLVGASHYDQKVVLISQKEFKQLPTLY